MLLASPGTPLRTSRYSPSPIECVAVLTPAPEKVTVQTVPLPDTFTFGAVVVPLMPVSVKFAALRLTAWLKE